MSEHFYKAVSQAVLLFGAETWVLTPRMKQDLDSFQHRVARRFTRRQPRRQVDASWAYPPLEEAMRAAGFEGMRKSVLRRQNTVAQYIVTRQIMDLCERSTQRPGARVSWQCWEQAIINLEGVNKRAGEAAMVSGSKPESDLDSDSDQGGEEDSKGAIGLSGADWTGLEE